MGEKWWPNGAWDMHPGFFYMPQICDMGPIILLPFPASAGFEPANLGIRDQHATSAPPRPLSSCFTITSITKRNRVVDSGSPCFSNIKL